jgi:hypothetical protein
MIPDRMLPAPEVNNLPQLADVHRVLLLVTRGDYRQMRVIPGQLLRRPLMLLGQWIVGDLLLLLGFHLDAGGFLDEFGLESELFDFDAVGVSSFGGEVSGDGVAGVPLFEFGRTAESVSGVDEHLGFGFVMEVESESLVEREVSLVEGDSLFEPGAIAGELLGGGWPGESTRSEVGDLEEEFVVDVFDGRSNHDAPCGRREG